MKFLVKLYLIIFSKKIGKDYYNNVYYEVTSKKNNKVKRFVVYKGLNEPTKVPPEWEAWLRFSVQKPIKYNSKKLQAIYVPNLTGTIYSYKYTRYKNTRKYKSHSSW